MKGLPTFVHKLFDGFFQNRRCIKCGGGPGGNFYYVFPKILSKKMIVYSGGAGEDISFEVQLLKDYNAKIFLFDPTPGGMDGLKEYKSKIRFIKKGLAQSSGKMYFDSPKEGSGGCYTQSNKKSTIAFECISISDFMKENHHKGIDLLKLDIEGFEYGVIDDLISKKIFPKQICLEFHHHLKNGSWIQTFKYISKLKKYGYKWMYLDTDNFTFVRKNLL